MNDALLHYIAPAILAGLFGIASALIAARISGASERRRSERDAKLQLEAWGRDFASRYAELQATNRPHAEAIRQQFAKAYLSIKAEDPKASDRYFIPAGAKLTVGRGENCDIALNDHLLSTVSAMIEMIGGKLFITDLNSTNGTSVNGKVIEAGRQHPLSDGDTVQLGAKTATVHILPNPVCFGQH